MFQRADCRVSWFFLNIWPAAISERSTIPNLEFCSYFLLNTTSEMRCYTIGIYNKTFRNCPPTYKISFYTSYIYQDTILTVKIISHSQKTDGICDLTCGELIALFEYIIRQCWQPLCTGGGGGIIPTIGEVCCLSQEIWYTRWGWYSNSHPFGQS